MSNGGLASQPGLNIVTVQQRHPHPAFSMRIVRQHHAVLANHKQASRKKRLCFMSHREPGTQLIRLLQQLQGQVGGQMPDHGLSLNNFGVDVVGHIGCQRLLLRRDDLLQVVAQKVGQHPIQCQSARQQQGKPNQGESCDDAVIQAFLSHGDRTPCVRPTLKCAAKKGLRSN